MSETQDKPKQPQRMPPVVTLDAKFYWDNATEGKFVAQQCSDCGEFRFPPRPMCPHCHSLDTDITELSGRGRVYTWIRPQHPKPMGFAELPTVAVIELEEGFRVVSNVVGIAFEEVEAGLPVAVEFAPTMKDKQVPVFRPVSVKGGQ